MTLLLTGNLIEERELSKNRHDSIIICGNKRKVSLDFTVGVTFDLSFKNEQDDVIRQGGKEYFRHR